MKEVGVQMKPGKRDSQDPAPCIGRGATPRLSAWAGLGWTFVFSATSLLSGLVACAAPRSTVELPHSASESQEAAALERGPRHPEAEARALEVLDAFMGAFSAADVGAMEAQFLFPHVRLASGTVTVLERPGDRPDLFAGFRAANPEWASSGWLRRDVISSSPNKVHLDTEFARYRADGSEIARYRSLYIVERAAQEGLAEGATSGERWGIRARSSYAP